MFGKFWNLKFLENYFCLSKTFSNSKNLIFWNQTTLWFYLELTDHPSDAAWHKMLFYPLSSTGWMADNGDVRQSWWMRSQGCRRSGVRLDVFSKSGLNLTIKPNLWRNCIILEMISVLQLNNFFSVRTFYIVHKLLHRLDKHRIWVWPEIQQLSRVDDGYLWLLLQLFCTEPRLLSFPCCTSVRFGVYWGLQRL